MPGEATPSSSTQNSSPPPSLPLRADANRAVRRRELVGVREQVHEHLRQALLIAAHDGHAVADLHLDALTALRDQRLDELARRDDRVVDHDVLMANRELPGLDAHALEQVVDEPREPLRAAMQRGDELALTLDVHRADAVAAAARSTRAAPPAACGTRARCSRARCRACGERPRAPSRRAALEPACRRPPAARSR